MPYHPGHRRVAPWQLAAFLLATVLLALLLVRSFQVGRERTLHPRPETVPSSQGALPAPVAPSSSAPTAAPISGPSP
jgi:hypothetical protein